MKTLTQTFPIGVTNAAVVLASSAVSVVARRVDELGRAVTVGRLHAGKPVSALEGCGRAFSCAWPGYGNFRRIPHRTANAWGRSVAMAVVAAPVTFRRHKGSFRSSLLRNSGQTPTRSDRGLFRSGSCRAARQWHTEIDGYGPDACRAAAVASVDVITPIREAPEAMPSSTGFASAPRSTLAERAGSDPAKALVLCKLTLPDRLGVSLVYPRHQHDRALDLTTSCVLSASTMASSALEPPRQASIMPTGPMQSGGAFRR